MLRGCARHVLLEFLPLQQAALCLQLGTQKGMQ